ncbi:AIR synthase family protein [Pedobacter frigidisoli]|uniref:AIR synthase family protein n=1 Tax=Pedobacter frigidisoli TaxID=2530455 RepID=UPI00292D9704|nr:AIR synthase family protein [Pedobacter frigidisoli]
MGLGKIDNDGLEEIILQHCGKNRSEVTCGPAFGVDVSVVNLAGGLALAMTSDPLSLIPSLGLQESAWLSVHLMANDMATTGFAPMYAQMVLNLPASLTKQDLNIYWEHVHQYCIAIGVAITGGHTGSIEGQNSTIAGGGTMLLTAPAQNILLSRQAQAGDLIVVTKGCATSSTAILSMSFPKTVVARLGTETYQKGCELFYQTSSLKEAMIANAAGQANAMHDVTEGGVLGAVYEMAIASGNGVEIDSHAIPVSQTAIEVCRLFEIDPRFCVGAGSMIMAVKHDRAKNLTDQLERENIQATIIGRFTAKEKGYKLREADELVDLPYFSTDPYWNAFFSALKKGWT